MRLYGIKNCDTVRKARRWLNEHDTEHQYHDFRSDGLDIQQVEQWLTTASWEVLLNKRGTTWRKLDETQKQAVNASNIAALLVEHPTLIKRPVLDTGNTIEIGFSEARYSELLNA